MFQSTSSSLLPRRACLPRFACSRSRPLTIASHRNHENLAITARVTISPPSQSINRVTQQKPRHSVHIHSTAVRPQGLNTNTINPATNYVPPQRGLTASLPKSWIPYAELVRLDKPVGTYYLFFPTLFSTLLAAPMAGAAPVQVLGTIGLFFAGALIMRGAGCAINDLWDRNLDPHVERTKFRPIARGAISPKNALIFTGSQFFAGLGVLLSFPSQCLWYGIPSVPIVLAYPLAKRITNYPQFVLGLAYSWGAFMGFPALGVDLLHNYDAMISAGALYTSCIAWTVLYDMIYAHMDIKDDVAAGIKSIALRHEHNTKAVLTGLAVTQVALLGAAGVAAGCGPVFFIGSCGSAAATLGLMIWKVQLKSVSSCWWWFRNGCLLTGGGISIGLLSSWILEDRNVPSETRT
ncbi:Para-hydroxybenzoate-polyprenyltransferase Coq2 [Penicillium taxi]|uniref:Para-hydroxybenzoate-polyprenyltransferase Coq2 n=1 Tax=Penicillium taxi TaxID=168475 RepID=UPI0025451013|nr:Para-hydroxybenzoate-polyprenyltransferase Coq2 [Penicillium taxi]KAJ5907966.1 Para-hydroxybenzoate-polyprenyltransferase Coq2 [Penicillium taxi]